MRHYPLFMDLKERRALVVGSGEVAERKAEALRRCGALVTSIRAFDPRALDGCALAIGAEAPEADLRALSAEARARGIPVNIVDRTELCSFITPSVIDRHPVTVAISSSGTAPVLARMLRSRIEAMIPPAYGRLAALADRFRAKLRRHIPDIAVRRRVLEDIFSGRVADLVFANRDSEAAALFVDKLDDSGPASRSGMVYLVGAGPGAADLLTLRAQRLLGEADVIVHDRLVTDDVLDMARRDAARINVGKARANHCMKQADISALLVRLCQEGKRVVRLKGGDPLVFGRGGEEAEALEHAGVAFEIVPGITAALACAAQARIPLTHRCAARSVTLVTGYNCDGSLDIRFPGRCSVWRHARNLHGDSHVAAAARRACSGGTGSAHAVSPGRMGRHRAATHFVRNARRVGGARSPLVQGRSCSRSGWPCRRAGGTLHEPGSGQRGVAKSQYL